MVAKWRSIGYFLRMANDRVSPRISAETQLYLKELLATGLYGSSIDGVARSLIEQGIREAIGKGHIKPKIIKPKSEA